MKGLDIQDISLMRKHDIVSTHKLHFSHPGPLDHSVYWVWNVWKLYFIFLSFPSHYQWVNLRRGKFKTNFKSKEFIFLNVSGWTPDKVCKCRWAKKNNQEAKIALYTVDINKQVCICFTNHYIIYYKQHTCVSKRSIYILCDKTFCIKRKLCIRNVTL